MSSPDAGPPNDPLYVRALVLKQGETTAVIAAVDAVAIGEIGSIGNDYLATVRAQLQRDLKIPPANVSINASHCHGIVCADIADRTVLAIKQAWENAKPARVGAGVGHEDRIMENRRMKLKNGREADVRHAYSMPADDQVAEIGPIDPQIGVLRFDARDGEPIAVVYNFACHPIQGVPSGRNTADITGFASQVIEDNLGQGAVALFVQGCGGDINPVMYKDVARPRDAEPLGNMLGLSTLKAVRGIKTSDAAELKLITETLELPRADLNDRIAQLESELTRLLRSLKGTSLNLRTFLPLVVQYSLAEEFPAYYSHSYLHQRMLGRDSLDKLDAENRRNIDAYISNIQVMEELTRVQTNLALLKKHQAQNVAAGKRTIDVEVVGLRVGEFVMVTFPGELTVRIGLNIKRRSPHPLTFVAGYTNGYIYYAPTAEQLLNVGNAQEDSDCILAPEWQEMFETRADEILKKL
ncbi:MAG: hypothetical protein EHM42_15435 [Planctomycetaceae bacterium]|nr:MAG: hypothetical protein EHM42_15435 [Planctomycetaceae bacterium]